MTPSILKLNLSILKKGDQFKESNYYILTVVNIGEEVNKGFNTYGKDVEFSVRTITGRHLANETRCINF